MRPKEKMFALDAHASIAEAANAIVSGDPNGTYSEYPVVDENARVVRVVSRNEIVKLAFDGKRAHDAAVTAGRDPIVVYSEDRVRSAANMPITNAARFRTRCGSSIFGRKLLTVRDRFRTGECVYDAKVDCSGTVFLRPRIRPRGP